MTTGDGYIVQKDITIGVSPDTHHLSIQLKPGTRLLSNLNHEISVASYWWRLDALQCSLMGEEGWIDDIERTGGLLRVLEKSRTARSTEMRGRRIDFTALRADGHVLLAMKQFAVRFDVQQLTGIVTRRGDPADPTFPVGIGIEQLRRSIELFVHFDDDACDRCKDV